MSLYISRVPQLDSKMVGVYKKWLSPDETDRFNRYRHENGAQTFLLGRGLIREQLSERVGCQPEEITLVLSDTGKPSLAPELQEKGCWHFSIAHTSDWVVLAVSESQVGVDIETISQRNILPVAKRYFSPAETEVLQLMEGNGLLRYFFQLWTLKEAEVKRTGSAMAKLMSETTFEVQGKKVFRYDINASGKVHYSLHSWNHDQLIALAGKEIPDFDNTCYVGQPLQGYKLQPIELIATSFTTGKT